MAQINVIGYVVQDITLKQSQKGNAYVHFFLKENIGQGRLQSYQVWIWDHLVPKLKRLKIKKGSLIWVTGSLELVDFIAKDGQEPFKLLKINCNDLGIIRVNPATNSAAESKTAESVPTGLPVILDGDRDQLPE